MGLFVFLKGGKSAPEAEPAPAPAPVAFPAVLGAPSAGICVAMEDIPDPVFSEGVLGVCCGVDPAEGKVCAPIDGEITQLTDTCHAVGMEAAGIEILIHVGVDTVEMKGDGFTCLVGEGQKVRKGQPLITMDLDKIRAAGHPATVITAVTNSDDFAGVTQVAQGAVEPGADLLRVEK